MSASLDVAYIIPSSTKSHRLSQRSVLRLLNRRLPKTEFLPLSGQFLLLFPPPDSLSGYPGCREFPIRITVIFICTSQELSLSAWRCAEVRLLISRCVWQLLISYGSVFCCRVWADSCRKIRKLFYAAGKAGRESGWNGKRGRKGAAIDHLISGFSGWKE